MATQFEKELEFVQLLCNPEYLRWLNSEGYFTNNEFREYLKYLMYFKDPMYSKFLTYPQCIGILEVLNSDNVLEILGDESFYIKLDEDQRMIWLSRSPSD